jgi:NADH-quinone oxidoreductase subunit C
MKTVEETKAAIEAAIPGAGVEFVPNPGPAAEHSLRLAPSSAVAVATFLRDAPDMAFDFLSNVSGVDWPDKEIAEKVKVTRTVTKTVDGPDGNVEQQVEETVEETRKRVEPGCLSPLFRREEARAAGDSHEDREPQRSSRTALAHAHLALG